jgi:ethanolamine ammonia-lyase small subunit
MAHAQARDAVHFPLDAFSLAQEMSQHGWDARVLRSTAQHREEYLQRPDKGRLLDPESVAEIATFGGTHFATVVADGLSALAVHRHAVPLLQECLNSGLFKDSVPIWIVQQGRVAIGDHIGQILEADLSIVIIGERPGLSSPDSLGIYITWQPRPGRKDAERNCISNIHSRGLSYEYAAEKLAFLVNEAQRRKLTGVQLKDTVEKLTLKSTEASRRVIASSESKAGDTTGFLK